MQVSVRMDSSFPRRRESRSVGAETYRIKRFLQSRVLDSHFRGNDEVEVTRNLKQAKPNEPDSRLRGNDEFQVAVFGFLFL